MGKNISAVGSVKTFGSVQGVLRDRQHDISYDHTPLFAKDLKVGGFGIVEGNGFENIIGWKVSGHRKDRRHGVIDKPEPQSPYYKHLLESMFKGWK